MSRWIYTLPIAAFAVLAFFLFRSLYLTPAEVALPSALIGKPAPGIALPALDAQAQGFGPADLASGKVVLVNVFSSTCIPCRQEAPELARLAAMPGITLYGFVWKDTAAGARDFLDHYGNPYSRIGFDADGHVGTEWGVYGWPETYVVDGRGIIRFKYVGALTDQVISQQLLPAIAQARSPS